jgi:tetratricopeptide (TPR) repeat protein
MGQETMDQLAAILEADPDHHAARCFVVQQSVEMAPELGLEVGDTEGHVRWLEAKDPVWGAKARCWLVGEDEQKRIWDKVLAEHPDDCHALMEGAEGLIMVGDLDRAETCLVKAMDQDRDNCYGLLRLGLAYFRREDWGRAKELTQQYLDTEPPVALKAYAVGRLGMIYLRKGNHDRGRQLMDKARAMDPHVWLTVMPPPREIFVSPVS